MTLTKPLRLNEVLRLITQLGGILARQNDGEPGVKRSGLDCSASMDAATTLQTLRDGHD